LSEPRRDLSGSPPARQWPEAIALFFVVVSRQALIDSKAARVVCAPINTTYVGLTTQVPVGVDEGLKHPSCINCDQLFTLDKSALTDFVAALSAAKLRQLRTALRIALAVE
jgi:mRNA interferase MazF